MNAQEPSNTRKSAARGHFCASTHEAFAAAAGAPSPPEAAVEAAVLDGFGDVFGLHGRVAAEVGDGAGDFENAVLLVESGHEIKPSTG
jgi:hypothetical protein